MLLSTFVVGLALAAPLRAQDRPQAQQKIALTLGISVFDLSGRLENGGALEIAYRPAWRLYRRVRPSFGAMMTPEGDAYGYLGLQLPISLHERLSVIPSFGGGVFTGRRRAQLGSAVEFRSGIDLDFDWFAEDSIVLSFYHLSNGGVGERNPGIEVLGLAYSLEL